MINKLLNSKLLNYFVLICLVTILLTFALIGLSQRKTQKNKLNITNKLSNKVSTTGKILTNGQFNNDMPGKKLNIEELKNQPGNLTLKQAKDKKYLAFDLKFPKDDSLTGKLEVINGYGWFDRGKGVVSRANTDIAMVFSKGIVVNQILPEAYEAKTLATYPSFIANDNERKKDFKKVKINGVYGLAAEPKIQDKTFGEAYKSPGSVSWFKNGILYTVWGDNVPVSKLIKIAKQFN